MNSTITASELANKYACSGPRYTSYPTAPQFRSPFGPGDLRDAMTQANASLQAPLSLYVHIPFCQDICYYCACNKTVTRNKAAGRRYLDYLRLEIALQSELYGRRRPVRQLHWGGGTPTFLDDAEITELMHELASHFHLLDQGQREYSIEVDPRTVDASRIALLRGLGFNRVSLGIQDFDPLVQKSINRTQPFAMVENLVGEIRRHKFRSLSFDLIYGLPHQDSYTMRDTLEKVVRLSPDRIACYNYAHLPDKFSSQRSIDRLTLPTPEDKLSLQAIISEQLVAAGYIHIGLDHYVLPTDDLALAQNDGRLQRNFQGYSIQMAEDLVGIGVSSISQVGDCYAQNERNIDAYYTRLDQGVLPVNRGCLVTAEDKLRRHIIMQLVCNLYVDIYDCNQLFNIDFLQYFPTELDQLRTMASDGLLTVDEASIHVTETGRPFLRNICMVFDQYLNSRDTTEPTPRYSATL